MNSMYAVDAYAGLFPQGGVKALPRGETAGYRIRGRLGKIFLRGRAIACGASRRCRLRSPLSGIAKAHVLLNVSPIFNRGMHRLVPAGMANHAVVLTG